MNPRKNTRASNGFTNKTMNETVYSERRIVMSHIYTAKNLLRSIGIEMPRIDIRIVTADRTKVSSIGRARMNDNMVWIPADTIVRYPKDLYKVVLHELLHAIWGVEHDLKCKLMHTNLQMDLTDDKAKEIFLSYAKKCNLS